MKINTKDNQDLRELTLLLQIANGLESIVAENEKATETFHNLKDKNYIDYESVMTSRCPFDDDDDGYNTYGGVSIDIPGALLIKDLIENYKKFKNPLAKQED